ncbi:tail-anchored insertion receptor WRB-like [Micractinium conductrix]|uniref:Tail-anchored insertion receptor WRB-like n=1 Tax=Micractinium conductrix TaxID=554055 RepID=A0A2P6VNG9_9CHLO|nr:tail-anchored insertion receptor WRB-like [Micractinium conductrix]|eukprot:PSC75651.1 tail-anchored insertion receptor WRB-like [Micractinium conductrix]
MSDAAALLQGDPGATAQLAAVVLLASFALTALDRLVRRWKVPDTRRRQAELAQEVAHLQRTAAVLNHPDTFAQSAKAERKAIALEKELTRLRQEQVEAGAQRVLRVPRALRVVLFLWLLFQSTSTPVVGHVRAEAAWPLGRWLRLGTGKGAPGAVGLLAWAMLCQRVSAAVLGRG